MGSKFDCRIEDRAQQCIRNINISFGRGPGMALITMFGSWDEISKPIRMELPVTCRKDEIYNKDAG